MAVGAALLAACGGTAQPAPGGPVAQPPSGSASQAAAAQPASGGASSSAAAKPGADWDKLVAAAKSEGKVTLSIGAASGQQARDSIVPAFKQDFGIDVEVISGPSTQMVSRLKLEQSSGLHTVDVVIGGADTMYLSFYGDKLIAPLRPLLIHPDALNGANWSVGKPWFMDPEGQYILRISNGVTGTTAINTKLLKTSDFTRASDLLKPEYRGKIAGFDPTINGSGAQHAAYFQLKLGADFVKKLFLDQQTVRTQDVRQLADWIGRGNYAIAVTMTASNIEQLKADGLPVSEIPELKDAPGYLTGATGLMAVVKESPHPNAAQLFVNWMAMAHGQGAYDKATQMVSPLTTVKNDWVPSYVIPKPGVDYLDTYSWDYTVNTYPALFEQVRKELSAG